MVLHHTHSQLKRLAKRTLLFRMRWTIMLESTKMNNGSISEKKSSLFFRALSRISNNNERSIKKWKGNLLIKNKENWKVKEDFYFISFMLMIFFVSKLLYIIHYTHMERMIAVRFLIRWFSRLMQLNNFSIWSDFSKENHGICVNSPPQLSAKKFLNNPTTFHWSSASYLLQTICFFFTPLTYL